MSVFLRLAATRRAGRGRRGANATAVSASCVGTWPCKGGVALPRTLHRERFTELAERLAVTAERAPVSHHQDQRYRPFEDPQGGQYVNSGKKGESLGRGQFATLPNTTSITALCATACSATVPALLASAATHCAGRASRDDSRCGHGRHPLHRRPRPSAMRFRGSPLLGNHNQGVRTAHCQEVGRPVCHPPRLAGRWGPEADDGQRRYPLRADHDGDLAGRRRGCVTAVGGHQPTAGTSQEQQFMAAVTTSGRTPRPVAAASSSQGAGSSPLSSDLRAVVRGPPTSAPPARLIAGCARDRPPTGRHRPGEGGHGRTGSPNGRQRVPPSGRTASGMATDAPGPTAATAWR